MFTDEDLKLWKSRDYNTPKFKDLLSRLEAAENVAVCDQLCDKHTELQKVWLKSKGEAKA